LQKNGSKIYFYLAIAISLCVIIQMFLAGAGLFNDASYWKGHTLFVHIFQYLYIILFLIALIAKMGKMLTLSPLALFVLCNIQYFTAYGFWPALHVVIPLAIFAWSLYLILKSFEVIRKIKS